jgi:hypothetical protein
MATKITEERARVLLNQRKKLLLTCLGAFVLFCILAFNVNANFDKLPMVGWLTFLIYWLAGVLYFFWLGRLAYGLGRSVIYYVGGTWLLSSVIFLIAHLVAYSNIRAAVAKEFEAKPSSVTT